MYKNEDERLFMGSTLKITDIIVDNTRLKHYISALRMFEQIMNGHFVNGKRKTRKLFLWFLRRVTALSVMDAIKRCEVDSSLLNGFLDENEYDTDAVMDDLVDVDCSNIALVVGDEDKTAKIIMVMNNAHGVSYALASCLAN